MLSLLCLPFAGFLLGLTNDTSANALPNLCVDPFTPITYDSKTMPSVDLKVTTKESRTGSQPPIPQMTNHHTQQQHFVCSWLEMDFNSTER
jgi:hypothetical protein